jgi:predicted esterase
MTGAFGLLRNYRGAVLVLLGIFSSGGAKAELTTEQAGQLVRSEPIVATSPVFSGNTFPPIGFLHKDVITGALGDYMLDVRYFDAGWNEVERPSAPGLYGAWIESHFQDGASDVRHLTLFKTGAADGASDGPGHPLDDAWWTKLAVKVSQPPDYLYEVRVPHDYVKRPQDRWPLILFLHGSGERGRPLRALEGQGPLGSINAGHALPFIVVSPLCPNGQWWSPEGLSRVLDQVEASYRVDATRIYVTGVSMGGFGVYDVAARYPQRFAAMAVLSGGGEPATAERLKTVPAWIFHGADDDQILPRYSAAIADAMKKEGAEVKLTILPGVGHGGWDKIYADPELYAWFLQHARGAAVR